MIEPVLKAVLKNGLLTNCSFNSVNVSNEDSSTLGTFSCHSLFLIRQSKAMLVINERSLKKSLRSAYLAAMLMVVFSAFIFSLFFLIIKFFTAGIMMLGNV